MLREVYLMPAYGKRYDTIEDMQAAWDDGKDFKVYGTGQYCSIRNWEQLAEMGYVTLFDVRSGVKIKLGTLRNA